MAHQPLLITILSLVVSLASITGVHSTSFTFTNKCEYTVWPGILSNAGVAPLSTTGFALKKGESKVITPPSKWAGRFWGRTLCTVDATTGTFKCATADCGSGKIECSGNGATPPATLAEFTLDGSGGLDFFDVSLVDGYNLPMLVVPQGGTSTGTGQNCKSTGCVVDLNGSCPSELKVMSDDGGKEDTVACKSACEAFGQPEYCCSGAYGAPDTCKPSSYSLAFKNACPRAYSYAYDDKTSTFTCANTDYSITFCPSPNTSQKSTQNNDSNTNSGTATTIDGTMVYDGAYGQSEISPSTCIHVSASPSIAGLVSITLATWQLFQLFY